MMQLIKLMCVFDKCRHEGNRYNALLHRNANNERILGILAVIKRFCNVKSSYSSGGNNTAKFNQKRLVIVVETMNFVTKAS